MTKPVRMLNKYHIKEMLLHGNPQYENFYKEELIQFCKIAQEELKKSKNKQEKAIEYIKNDLQISILPNNQIINGTEVVKRINKIANILQGGDE